MTTENTRAARETLMWSQNLADAKLYASQAHGRQQDFRCCTVPSMAGLRPRIQTAVLGVHLAFLRTCHRGSWGLWGTRRVFPRQHLLPVDICGPLEVRILRMCRYPWDRDSLGPGKEMDIHGKATSSYAERAFLWH